MHGVTVEDSLHALETLFKADIEPSRVAAIIIEPVQGEGGFYIAPPELLRGLRKVCDEHGILLIFDEVQTGFGRTGKLFATEHYDVLPDIMTMAKSMAGGMTLSAVCGKAEVMDAPAPGGLGGTYAGNPLAIAASHAVIDVMEQEKLVERSNLLGEKLMARLKAAQATRACPEGSAWTGFNGRRRIFRSGHRRTLARCRQTRAAGGAGRRFDPAHLRRLRQCGALPLPADDRRCGIR